MSDTKEIAESFFEIQNTMGIHARPAAKFVQLASEFDADINVEKDGQVVDGKSLMGLLMLAAGFGTKIKISVNGPEAKEALEAIGNLINQKFKEE